MTGLGFVGVGGLGEALIRDLPKVPGLELAGVQDVRLDLAEAVGSRYASPWFGEDFEDLLALPTVEVVVICTPNALHVPQASAALRARKDVLVQKPLALSSADADAIVALARASGRLLLVDYSYRFLETMLRLKEALAQMGPVRSGRAVFHNIYGPGHEKTWFFDPALSGGGALVDLGVHLLDLALWLLEPVEVSVERADLDTRPIDQAASLRVALDTVPFDLDVSWNAPRPRTEISLDFDAQRGRVRWENVDGSFFRFRTLCDEDVLVERETTLREDTLRALAQALADGEAPPIDARVYALLDRAYGRAQSPVSARPRTAPAPRPDRRRRRAPT